MHKFAKRSLVLFLVAALVLVPLGSSVLAGDIGDPEEITADKMVADALLVRPLGICATLIGTGLFVISLPFSALGGNVKAAAHKLIVAPAKFTFKRPLGEL